MKDQMQREQFAKMYNNLCESSILKQIHYSMDESPVGQGEVHHVITLTFAELVLGEESIKCISKDTKYVIVSMNEVSNEYEVRDRLYSNVNEILECSPPISYSGEEFYILKMSKSAQSPDVIYEELYKWSDELVNWI